MRKLGTWDPLNELADIRDSFDRFFNRGILKKGKGEDVFGMTEFTPSVSMAEEDGKLVVEAELPGVDRKDVNISVSDSTLRISGETKKEKKDEKKGKYYYSERYYGVFNRTIDLPAEVDEKKAKASYRDGILKVEIPRTKEAKEKETRVTVE